MAPVFIDPHCRDKNLTVFHDRAHVTDICLNPRIPWLLGGDQQSFELVL